MSSIHARLHPELRDLLVKEASEHYPASINDVIARVLADHYGRPDLAVVPRKRMGRPPKKDASRVRKQSA